MFEIEFYLNMKKAAKIPVNCCFSISFNVACRIFFSEFFTSYGTTNLSKMVEQNLWYFCIFYKNLCVNNLLTFHFFHKISLYSDLKVTHALEKK
jgi:hypothetical protein